MNNISKWLINYDGLMGGEENIIYVLSREDGKEVIVGFQRDPKNESTYREIFMSDSEYSEFNHENYAYTRRIENND